MVNGQRLFGIDANDCCNSRATIAEYIIVGCVTVLVSTEYSNELVEVSNLGKMRSTQTT